ncbi:MAG: hypothetical protein IJ170_07250 [Ruminococcus sp.]|nr:hypothetical protein [Ruminococcus sp.]
MKLYRLILRDRYGEEFVYTVSGASLYDAMKSVMLDPGWQLAGYSCIGRAV